MARPTTDFIALLQATPIDRLNAALTSLTPQERVVLDFIVRGHCNKEICKDLGIEITTAKAHTSRIFKKLGVKNRVQAAVFGLWATLLSTTDEQIGHPQNDDTTAQSHAAGSSGNIVRLLTQ